jgi:hypothetical protein
LLGSTAEVTGRAIRVDREHAGAMDERFRTLERAHGVFLRREALELGYDDRMILRALRLKIWTRVRHGAYCFFDTWQGATDLEQHLSGHEPSSASSRASSR